MRPSPGTREYAVFDWAVLAAEQFARMAESIAQLV